MAVLSIMRIIISKEWVYLSRRFWKLAAHKLPFLPEITAKKHVYIRNRLNLKLIDIMEQSSYKQQIIHWLVK